MSDITTELKECDCCYVTDEDLGDGCYSAICVKCGAKPALIIEDK